MDFTLTSDYIGKLDYLFFGDDDLWVYLEEITENNNIISSKLICDVGEVKKKIVPKIFHYRLSIYYTERGISGSSCYMMLTLPWVSGFPVIEDINQQI